MKLASATTPKTCILCFSRISTNMTGPPTPPPTSQTEIADEARAAVPVAVDPSLALPPATVAPIQQKQGPQDSYQLLFPTLANLAFQDEYKQIVAVAEREDLKVCYSTYRSRDSLLTNLWSGRERSTTHAFAHNYTTDSGVSYSR